MPKYVEPKRCLKFGEKKPPKKGSGPIGKHPHLVHKDGHFLGILSRDHNYKFNARSWMKDTRYYDDESQIREGVSKEDSVRDCKNEKTKNALIDERVPKYKFDYVNLDIGGFGGVKNFTGIYRPYLNNAHHILPCQVFYHKDWTVERLTTVKSCGYNINNEGNILYMPNQSEQNKYGEYDKCFFHGFPNHCQNHQLYNDEVCTTATKLMDKADEAKCGDKKKLEELFNMLIDIEKEFYKYLIERKPGLPMWE